MFSLYYSQSLGLGPGHSDLKMWPQGVTFVGGLHTDTRKDRKRQGLKNVSNGKYIKCELL